MSDSQLKAIKELRAAGAHIDLDESENAVALVWGLLSPMTEAGMMLMATLKSLIDVRLDGMTDAWIKYVAQLPNLRRLYFGMFGAPPKVTDAGVIQLAGLTKLQDLGLEHTDVTLVGLKQLRHLTQLTTLTVPDSIGLEYVRLFPNLEQVYNFGVRDAELVFLIELRRLKVLGILSAVVTDAGLEHLTKLTSLAALYLFDTKITEDGFTRLQKALPNCQIDHGLGESPAWRPMLDLPQSPQSKMGGKATPRLEKWPNSDAP